MTQLSLLNRRQPVSEVLDAHSTDTVTKEKLAFSKQVLEFAKEEGLQVGSSYQTFVKLDGPAVSYVVQAAYPDQFKLKTWWFPIVGTVPYLGFFDPKDRDEYAEELLEKGYEVHKGAASAFSSLGWFSDPIYSSMLNDNDVGLAELFFHELTHQTAWIKGSVEFNENFAEFVAETLAEKFFVKIDRQSDLVQEKIRKKDRELFKHWLKQLKEDLELYFSQVSLSASKVDIVSGKESIITRHIEQKPKFEVLDFVSKGVWNTPRILGASLYSPDTAKFQSAYKCFKNDKIAVFVLKTKEAVEKSEDPDEALNNICH